MPSSARPNPARDQPRFFSFGPLTAPPAGAAGNNKLLTGEYAEAGTETCLYAPGGFNTILQPNVPANSIVATASLQGVWTFNGAGSVSEASTDFITSRLGAASSGFVPNVTASTTRGARKYVVDATDGVTVTLTNGKWKIYTVNSIVFEGPAGSDGATVTLGTATPAVETITFSNGDTSPRICHRSIVLLKE